MSFGAAPGVLLAYGIRDQASYAFSIEYRHREELLRRAVEVGEIQNPTKPSDFVRWARDRTLDIAKELVERFDQELAQSAPATLDDVDEQAPPPRVSWGQEKPLSTREKDTLLKMIIAMAVDQYGYNPSSTRSDVSARIREDLSELNLSLDEDTIRDKLKAAAALLDGDVLERLGR